MKTLTGYIFALLVAINGLEVYGQSNNEFFVGFSVLNADYGGQELPNPPIPIIVAFDPEQTLHGLNGSYTRHLGNGFGLTGDVSAHFKKNSFPDPLGGNIEERIRVWNILGGPQYKIARSKRVSPFVHALAGVAHTRLKLVVPSLSSSETSTSTDFAIALGGGLDIRVNDNIAVRAIQADYNPIFLRGGNALGFGETRADNFRFSFGVVFR